MKITVDIEVSDAAMVSIQSILDRRKMTIQEFLAFRIGNFVKGHEDAGKRIQDAETLQKLKAAPKSVQDQIDAVVLPVSADASAVASASPSK